jgi:hypothetical protein
VDTANSGHSGCALADILKALWKNSKDGPEWLVDFYLLFARTGSGRRQPPLSAEIERLSTGRLRFRVFPHPVPDLVVEDWDEALGIRCYWGDGASPQMRVVPSKGELAVQERDGSVRVVESDRLDRYTDVLLGESVSDAVVTEPGFRHTYDVWSAYLPADGVPPTAPGPSRPAEGR